MSDNPSTDQTRAVAANATAAYMSASSITFAVYISGVESGGRAATDDDVRDAQAVSQYAALKAALQAARAARCQPNIAQYESAYAEFWAGCDAKAKAAINALNL